MGLTPKQARFCEEYVIDLNGKQAAIRAGYSHRSAEYLASFLIRNNKVAARIAELQEGSQKRNELKADDVINELRALAFWDISEFLKEDNQVTDISKLPKSKNKPIVGVVVKERFTKTGERLVSTELKFADKRAALVDLGKHLGIFQKDNEQSKTVVNISGMEIK